jgi:hypothetical protein
MHIRKDTVTHIELYCCGLISHTLSERSTATSLLQSLLYSLPEMTSSLHLVPQMQKHQRYSIREQNA